MTDVGCPGKLVLCDSAQEKSLSFPVEAPMASESCRDCRKPVRGPYSRHDRCLDRESASVMGLARKSVTNQFNSCIILMPLLLSNPDRVSGAFQPRCSKSLGGDDAYMGFQQEASITRCDLVRPKLAEKPPKHIISHDVLEPLRRALSAACNVIISNQICCSKLQSVITLGDGRRLPRNVMTSSSVMNHSPVCHESSLRC